MWLTEEGEMTTGERWALINNLVAEASESSLKKDDTKINCFVRIGCLLHRTKSEADGLIKG